MALERGMTIFSRALQAGGAECMRWSTIYIRKRTPMFLRRTRLGDKGEEFLCKLHRGMEARPIRRREGPHA